MSFFQTWAYLSPLVVGFGVPAALALTSGCRAGRRALAAGGVLAVDLLVLLAASLADSPRLWAPAALLLAAFALLAAGLYLALESVRASREVAQIGVGLVVCLLMSSMFIFGPVIRESADNGTDGPTVSRRITLAMRVNPFFVMAYSIFQADPLYLPVYYRTDLAGFQHEPPTWPASSAAFAAAGALLGLAGLGLRRVIPR